MDYSQSCHNNNKNPSPHYSGAIGQQCGRADLADRSTPWVATVGVHPYNALCARALNHFVHVCYECWKILFQSIFITFLFILNIFQKNLTCFDS